MFVGRCALATLSVLFVDQALDDAFDKVGEEVTGNACAYGEEYSYEHGVKKLGAFGLGEVSFGEGAGYVVFVPGGGEFFQGDVKIGGERDLICLVGHGCLFPFYSFKIYLRFKRLAACGT